LKALNLQRDASGLGEDLDYAYKIADAQALAQNLAAQLNAANGALRDSQQALNETQEQLFAARESARRQELQMAGLLANLEEARREAASADSSRVDELEQEIATVKAQLVDSQNAIFNLEQERDTARAELETELAGGQATQLELRELIARTERAEGAAETLSAQLAEARQRLIHSDEEIRRLQIAYREQSDQLAAQSERLLAARARSESDADAYIAAQETEIALRETRIASLETQIANLQQLLGEAGKTDVEDALRQEIATLRARYENDMTTLQRDRDELKKSQSAGTTQLASREARIKILETQIRNLQASLRDAQKTDTEDALRQEIATLRARYDNDVAALQHDRDELRQSQSTGGEQLASREARIASLEAQIRNLTARLRDAQKTDVEDALRQDIEALETRYENDLVALRHERDSGKARR
jgi:chromosome segregation ATPase